MRFRKAAAASTTSSSVGSGGPASARISCLNSSSVLLLSISPSSHNLTNSASCRSGSSLVTVAPKRLSRNFPPSQPAPPVASLRNAMKASLRVATATLLLSVIVANYLSADPLRAAGPHYAGGRRTFGRLRHTFHVPVPLPGARAKRGPAHPSMNGCKGGGSRRFALARPVEHALQRSHRNA